MLSPRAPSMPTYEYQCPSGHRFERFVRKISDAETAPPCPECGQPATRLISGAGLVFKGSGFYITDYGKDGKKPQQPAGGAAKSESKSEGKGDAPAAPPAPAKPESASAPKKKGGE